MHPLKRNLITGKNKKKEKSRQGRTAHVRSSTDPVCFDNIIIDDKAEDDQKNYTERRECYHNSHPFKIFLSPQQTYLRGDFLENLRLFLGTVSVYKHFFLVDNQKVVKFHQAISLSFLQF